MRHFFIFAFSAGVAVAACSSNNNNGNNGARTCCSTSDDAGGFFCTCQVPGTVQMGGFTATLTVSGTSCTSVTVFNGTTSTQMGTVVSACPD